MKTSITKINKIANDIIFKTLDELKDSGCYNDYDYHHITAMDKLNDLVINNKDITLREFRFIRARIEDQLKTHFHDELEEESLSNFEEADVGIFDGFQFIDAFHRDYNKADAVKVAESDDSAKAEGTHGDIHEVGADGVTVYFMPHYTGMKQVRFNRSVYIF